MPVNIAEREASAAEKRLVLAQRSLNNTIAQVESERARQLSAREEARSIIEGANELASAALTRAETQANALIHDAREKMAKASSADGLAKESAARIITEAEIEANRIMDRNIQEMVEMVSQMAFLRKEIERMAHERKSLAADVEELTDKKADLDKALGILGRKFDAVTEGLK